MKVCPKCQSEYRDEVAVCEDDGAALVDGAVVEAERAARAKEAEVLARTVRFVPAAQAEDPFQAEAYVAAVDEARIPVLSRARRLGTVEVLTTPGSAPFWEILVPEDKLAGAQVLIAERKRQLEAESAEAARAAEEEEQITEGMEVAGEAEAEAVAAGWVAQLKAAGLAAELLVQSDVEADSVDEREPDRFLVLVPREQAARARAVLAAGAGAEAR